MIITHKKSCRDERDKCLSHQMFISSNPAIEKGWKDEGKDVHFFGGLAKKYTVKLKHVWIEVMNGGL